MKPIHKRNQEIKARFCDLLSQYRSQQNIYTQLLILVVVLVFFVEILTFQLLNAPSIGVTIDYLFFHYPWLMWPLAPFLHRGVGHLVANTVMLIVLSPMESHISKYVYGALFVGTGVFSTYVGGWYLVTFSEKSKSAFYGISGFVYGLAGFALCYTVFSLYSREDADTVALIIGFTALLSVGWDFYTAIGSPLHLNPGHTYSFFAGIAIWVVSETCSNSRS